MIGNWADADAVYRDRRDRRSTFERGKCESSVWGSLSVRCLRASQKEYRSGHPVWGSRGSLKMRAQSRLISTQPDLPFGAMKMQKQKVS